MLRRLFDSFYKGNIEKIAKEIAANNEGIAYVPNLNGAYEEYLNQKTALKRLIKGFNEQKDDLEILLDGHKVATGSEVGPWTWFLQADSSSRVR